MKPREQQCRSLYIFLASLRLNLNAVTKIRRCRLIAIILTAYTSRGYIYFLEQAFLKSPKIGRNLSLLLLPLFDLFLRELIHLLPDEPLIVLCFALHLFEIIEEKI